MAKDKEFPNKLKVKPQFLNDLYVGKLANFGQVNKLVKDFSFDEIVDWYNHSSERARKHYFLGVVPPDYKSPFDKKFPKAPKIEDETTE